MVRVLGIDPGISGALAVLHGNAVTVRDMPVTAIKSGARTVRRIIPELLADLIRDELPLDAAWVEKVHAMPKQGVSSSFTFGMSYGIVLGILAALDIPTTLITPQEWRKTAGVRGAKLGSRHRACQLFPTQAHLFALAKHDGRAEACLIAHAGLNR